MNKWIILDDWPMKSLYNWVVVYPLHIPNQPGVELITALFASYFLNSHFFDGVTQAVTHVSPFCWCFPRNLSCGVPISMWTSWQSSPFPQRTGSAMRKKSRCALAIWFIFDWCLIKWVVPVVSLNTNMPGLTVTMKILAFVGGDHTVGMPAQVCKFVDNKNQLPSDQLQTLN